jgi:hypothetical protein
LFVKNKERVFDVSVLVDVVPGVNGQYTAYGFFRLCADCEVCEFTDPVG